MVWLNQVTKARDNGTQSKMETANISFYEQNVYMAGLSYLTRPRDQMMGWGSVCEPDWVHRLAPWVTSNTISCFGMGAAFCICPRPAPWIHMQLVPVWLHTPHVAHRAGAEACCTWCTGLVWDPQVALWVRWLGSLAQIQPKSHIFSYKSILC